MKKLRKFLRSVAESYFVFPVFILVIDFFRRKKISSIKSGNLDLLGGLSTNDKNSWKERSEIVALSEDNQKIKLHPDTGKIVDESLIMHNGVKIDPLSYYNYPMLHLLMNNNTIHEPQEEYIFQEILNSLNKDNEYIMIELGAYWSFYSLWFAQILPKTKNYMVEPSKFNLHYGKKNFKLNNKTGVFINGFIGAQPDKQNKVYSIDQIAETWNIPFIDILHSDIQGFEYDMLLGSENLLKQQKVGYMFISTHSKELHYKCRDYLVRNYGFMEVASIDPDESFSVDGILVLRSPNYSKGKVQIEVSKRT